MSNVDATSGDGTRETSAEGQILYVCPELADLLEAEIGILTDGGAHSVLDGRRVTFTQAQSEASDRYTSCRQSVSE